MLWTRDLRRTDGWKVRLTDVRMDGRTDKWTEQDPNNVYARSFIKQGCIFMKKQTDIVNIIHRNFSIKETNPDFLSYCIFLNINNLL